LTTGKEENESHGMSALLKIAALYLAGIKVALRMVAVLLGSLLALIALVLVSIPSELFSTNDAPLISVAVVYGDGDVDDLLTQRFESILATSRYFDEVGIYPPDEASEKLATGEVDAVIILPKDMLSVLVYGGHTTITLQSNDPLVGSILYITANNYIETINSIQSYALIYADATRDHFSTPEEHFEAVSEFNVDLFNIATIRLRSVETPWQVHLYYVQILTLLLFMVASVGSFFIAVLAARSYASGHIRHLFIRGVRFRHLLVSQLLLSASIALIFGGIFAVVLLFLNIGLSAPRIVVATVVMSVLLTSLYLVFSGFRGQPQAATTRTLMGCLALMFILLFIGGGFYPTGLMESSIRFFNPAWLSEQLSVWSFGGSISLLQLVPFLALLIVTWVAGYLEWRHAL